MKFKEGAKTREERRQNFDKIIAKHFPNEVGDVAAMNELFESFEELFKILGYEKETAWVVHDMTGMLTDKEFETEDQALSWKQHIVEWNPNARPIIKQVTK